MAETAVADTLAEAFVIEGEAPRGSCARGWEQNAALPLLAACALAQDEVRLENVPRIRDVEEDHGPAERHRRGGRWTGPTSSAWPVCRPLGASCRMSLCSRMRAPILLAGPLLARFGRRSCRRRAAIPSGAAALDVQVDPCGEPLGAGTRTAARSGRRRRARRARACGRRGGGVRSDRRRARARPLGRSARAAVRRAGSRRACGCRGFPTARSASPATVDVDLVRARPFGLPADVVQEGHHRLDVADPRDVLEPHLVLGEDAGCEQRQRRVLVSSRAHATLEGPSALDYECFGKRVRNRRFGHRCTLARCRAVVATSEASRRRAGQCIQHGQAPPAPPRAVSGGSPCAEGGSAALKRGRPARR